MDKVKDTMRKGFEKATKINDEPAPEKKHDALNTTYPAQAHLAGMVGGTDTHLGNVAAHTGQREVGKSSMGQPSSKP
ncbi:hypothetical protein QBC40DRAFT_13918 [Triangularia verruculosa]|uniref:Uncharacterized protein n=1 Tax=Triangularia verruculosa TaxID=2587418 RepID=A0AAN7AR38_9PEZI|nr:hypothetical protein QBC40DRAFT_13918 [Triangularia verruculosa]